MAFRHGFIVFVVIVVLHLAKTRGKHEMHSLLSHDNQFQIPLTSLSQINTISTQHTPKVTYPPKKQVEEIIFSFSDIGLRRIPEDFIINDMDITLNLDKNEISNVSASAFHKMPNLKFLNISNNKIPTNELFSFVGLGNLQTLIIDNNKFDSDFKEATLKYEVFNRLETLHLCNSQMKNLQVPYHRAMPALRYLHLCSNDIESSDIVLSNIPNTLIHIYLDNNQIDMIEPDKLRYLQKVSLNNNLITEICLETCKNDKYMSLRNANYLQTLSLVKNQISKVAVDAFKHTEALRQLDLSGNNINDLVTGTLNYTIRLEKLVLADNKLTVIPNISMLRSLRSLNLNDNNFKTIYAGSFYPSTSLQYLYLANNGIESVETHAFVTLRNLEHLDMSGNCLKHLPSQWIYHQNLLELHLERNLFQQLEDASLTDIKTLRNVYLEDNPMVVLRSRLFHSLQSDLILHISTYKKEDKSSR